jgi:single-strand DNA-binding protein
MSADVNTIAITGRLTREPELKNIGNDVVVCNFSVANNFYAGKGKEEGVSFLDCKAFGKGAEVLAKYMKKGSKITLSGQLRQERWTKEGKNFSRCVINVQQFNFGERKEGDAPAGEPTDEYNPPANEKTSAPPPSNGGIFSDDEVPF